MRKKRTSNTTKRHPPIPEKHTTTSHKKRSLNTPNTPTTQTSLSSSASSLEDIFVSSLEDMMGPVGGYAEDGGEVKMGEGEDVVGEGEESMVGVVEDEEQIKTVLGVEDEQHAELDGGQHEELDEEKKQETIPLLNITTPTSTLKLHPKSSLHPSLHSDPQLKPKPKLNAYPDPKLKLKMKLNPNAKLKLASQHQHKSVTSKLRSYRSWIPNPPFSTHTPSRSWATHLTHTSPTTHTTRTAHNTHAHHAPQRLHPLRRILFLLPLTSPRRVLLFLATVLLCAPAALVACVLGYGGVPPRYADVRAEEARVGREVGGVGDGMSGGVGDGMSGGVGDKMSGGGGSRMSGGGRASASATGGGFGAAGAVGAKGGGSLRWGGRQRGGVGGDAAGAGDAYLRFPDHLWGHGFNNVLQETLFTSYLAYALNRTYVFEDYTWSRLPLPYTIYDFTFRPTRIPMGAFLGGPIVGEPFALSSSESPLSSSASYSNDSWNGTQFDPKQGSGATRPVEQTQMAVPAQHFKRVCPPDRVFVLEYEYPPDFLGNPRDVDRRGDDNGEGDDGEERYDLKGPREGLDGVDILRWWAWRMQQDDVRDQKCVEVRERKRRVFDAFFFGSTRLLPLYPAIKESPVLKGFKWSRIIRRAADRVARRMMQEASATTSPSANLQSPLPPTSGSPSFDSSAPSPESLIPVPTPMTTPIPGLVALHLRRGDYKRHCARLAGWESRYMGFNRFEGLLDKFEPWGDDEVDDDDDAYQNGDPTISDDGVRVGWGQPTSRQVERDESPKDAMMKHYMKHCLPSIPQIVQRLRRIRADHTNLNQNQNQNPNTTSPAPTLDKVYILTNAWPSYVSALRRALQKEGWANVWSTADFARDLDRRERGVDVGVDMALAVEKADVFVGNGFSSMSANIVMLRLASGFEVSTNRFL